MDEIDRLIINSLQGGFPVCDAPFNKVANEMGISEDDLIRRIQNLLDNKILSRFGPMYDIQKLNGSFSLCALRVPLQRFDEIAAIVNSFDEVAHNYERDHEFNMWYVLATESVEQIDQINHEIENLSGLKVYNMPKLQEFFVGLHFEV